MFVDSLRSRAVLVTGAGGGVGLALAGQLAAAGWTVIVHAGTAEAGDQAVERLVKAGAEPLRLEVVSADFNRLGETARMARQVGERHPSLDLLVKGQATLALTMFTRALAKREPSPPQRRSIALRAPSTGLWRYWRSPAVAESCLRCG
jgi:NAD(P)-dependent dehydrogenase (short-subunit alcohol dehydrogenase family)